MVDSADLAEVTSCINGQSYESIIKINYRIVKYLIHTNCIKMLIHVMNHNK